MNVSIPTTVILCMLAGCGGHPGKGAAVPTSAYCAPKTEEVIEVRVGERHHWCKDKNGVAHGPFEVQYANGRRKVAFTAVRGLADGPYEGWHSSGRWAIQTAYAMGAPQGHLKMRPPLGPPTECPAARCGHRANVLDRPHCLPEDIDAIFAAREELLQSCLAGGRQAGQATVLLKWSINLTGRPQEIKVSSRPDLPVEMLACIENVLVEQRFPAPFGDVCEVSLDFQVTLEPVAAPEPSGAAE